MRRRGLGFQHLLLPFYVNKDMWRPAHDDMFFHILLFLLSKFLNTEMGIRCTNGPTSTCMFNFAYGLFFITKILDIYFCSLITLMSLKNEINGQMHVKYLTHTRVLSLVVTFF